MCLFKKVQLEEWQVAWSAPLLFGMLKDSGLNQKSLSLWLDLANTYGIVPHKLIEYAVKG